MKNSPISCNQVDAGLFPFQNESQHDYQAVCGHVTGAVDLEGLLQAVDDHDEYLHLFRGPDPDVVACYQSLLNITNKQRNERKNPWGTWPQIGHKNYRATKRI